MAWILVLIALTVGVVLPAQAGINSQLRVWLGHPIQAALVSFTVGALALATISVALRLSWPSVDHVGAAPWWVWVGGIFGATYVSMAVVLAPRLGAAHSSEPASRVNLSVRSSWITTVLSGMPFVLEPGPYRWCGIAPARRLFDSEILKQVRTEESEVRGPRAGMVSTAVGL